MTRRRLGILLVAFAVAVGLAVPAAATAGGLAIAEAGNTSFPARAYVLSLPRGMHLRAGDVHVTENGNSVGGLTLVPVAQAQAKDFGTALNIDASTSMEGRPEEAAFSAARLFAARRKPHEQLAIVTYNLSPTVLLPFTANSATISSALEKPVTFGFGTHIFDAITRSLDLLRVSHITAGTIIVLSDGQEHRGHNDQLQHESEASAAALARADHVRVFTVGLRSRLSNLGVLEQLARDTGGEYVEATSINRLAAIYDQLGSQLANEYLLRYDSLAGPGKRISVRIRVDGVGEATTQYVTPKLAVAKTATKRPYSMSLWHRILTAPITMVLIGLITAGLIGGGAVAALMGPRRGTVRRRMAEFVSIPAAIRKPSRRPSRQLTEKMLEGTSEMLGSSSRWQKFKWELNVAMISMPAEQIVVLTVIASLLALVLIEFVFGSLLAAIVIALAIPLGVRSYLKHQLARRRLRFAEQLPDNLNVLASALRAGHSFIGALSVVVNDAAEPSKFEFQRVVADEQLGVPLEDALHVVVERMDSSELEQVALVAALQHETGGNTAEVLDRVTDTIRERFELRRTVRTLTAQGRMSRWVLTMLPLFLLLVITLINPGYMNILYSSTVGKVLLVLAAVSVTAGSLVIKRIVNIKV